MLVMTAMGISAGIGEVIAAFKSGSVSQIARFFDNQIEIGLPDRSNSYSKSQAEMVLQDFFNQNPVKGFEVLHKGGGGGSEYCNGTLLTRNGAFRTTLYMKQKSGVQVLQEIRFESK